MQMKIRYAVGVLLVANNNERLFSKMMNAYYNDARLFVLLWTILPLLHSLRESKHQHARAYTAHSSVPVACGQT